MTSLSQKHLDPSLFLHTTSKLAWFHYLAVTEHNNWLFVSHLQDDLQPSTTTLASDCNSCMGERADVGDREVEGEVCGSPYDGDKVSCQCGQQAPPRGRLRGCSELGFCRTSRLGGSNPLQSYHVAIIYGDRCGTTIWEVWPPRWHTCDNTWKIEGVDRDGLGFLHRPGFGGYACQNLCFTHTYDLTKAKGTH
jgi:hypothetical protein